MQQTCASVACRAWEAGGWAAGVRRGWLRRKRETERRTARRRIRRLHTSGLRTPSLEIAGRPTGRLHTAARLSPALALPPLPPRRLPGNCSCWRCGSGRAKTPEENPAGRGAAILGGRRRAASRVRLVWRAGRWGSKAGAEWPAAGRRPPTRWEGEGRRRGKHRVCGRHWSLWRPRARGSSGVDLSTRHRVTVSRSQRPALRRDPHLAVGDCRAEPPS
mmetsp:Transcript_26983/g.85562  ORF Transcript_26983/g.85562 Transcript_26983/m.85562 type:complete len:218 (-) Transcript_26983:1777-2430(-)